MTPYADVGRLRAEPAPSVAAAERAVTTQRLSIARRPALDLPLAAAPATADRPPELLADPEFEGGSTFDVPAFLRRQEG